MPGAVSRNDRGVRAGAPVRADRRAQSLDGLGPALLVAATAVGGVAPVHLLPGTARYSPLLAGLAAAVATVLVLAWAASRRPAVPPSAPWPIATPTGSD